MPTPLSRTCIFIRPPSSGPIRMRIYPFPPMGLSLIHISQGLEITSVHVHVSHLAGASAPPVVHPAADDDAAADSGSDRKAQGRLGPRRCPGHSLRQAGAVHIILHLAGTVSYTHLLHYRQYCTGNCEQSA